MAALDTTVQRLFEAETLTPREVMELLWLRSQLSAEAAPRADEAADREVSEHDESGGDDGDNEASEEDDMDVTDEPLHAYAPVVAARAVGVPDVQAPGGGWTPKNLELAQLPQLSDAVAQQSGLGRLALTRADSFRRELDLPATIAQSCRAGEPFLATRAPQKPSTHVVLLIDTSATMTPWGNQTERLKRLVKQSARFAAQSVVELDLSCGDVLAEGAALELTSLVRSGMDNQLLLWTDGLAPGFAQMGALLSKLAPTTRFAWLHPWPRNAWRRTPEGRLRSVRSGRPVAAQSDVALLVAGADRAGWAGIAALLRGQRPVGLPMVALPVQPPPPRAASVLPERGDEAGWAAHLARLEAHLHPDTLRLIGLLAAFPAPRFALDAIRALASHAGLDATRFLIAEALTSGLLRSTADAGGPWFEFRDPSVRDRASLLLDQRDLRHVLALAEREGLIERADGAHPPLDVPVLVEDATGDASGRATDVTTLTAAADGHASLDAPGVTGSEGGVAPADGPSYGPTDDAPDPVVPDGATGRTQQIVHRSHAMSLPKRLQPLLRVLEKDLLERTRIAGVEAGLRAAWEAEKKAGETGQGFDPWRRARVTQIAAAWVLSVVFVRTLEDRGLIDPRIAGPDVERLKAALDREATFVQLAPFLGPREYLLAVFRELSRLRGAREVFDARHNPVWVLSPSSDGARALLDFFQQLDAERGTPALTFLGLDTRFLGDLYQDLSESVRKRYALLQTPDFVEKFILEQTLAPAIAEFGLAQVRIIDPTCGSGHFLLGALRDLLVAWREKEPTTPIETLAHRALGQIYGVDINPYAVAIARFRLVLAVLDAVGITRLDKAPLLQPHVVAADSLLHRVAPQTQLRLSEQVSMEEWSSWGDGLFRLGEPAAVGNILGQRYHAVVGNPPYITEKDASKRKRYRQMYESAAGAYALAAPFTERFFDIAVDGGFVGLINGNAWTKQKYGTTLIQKVLARLDVQKIVDTSGCYLPGHGTPTLLLFGRNRRPESGEVTAVLGKRGEREVPLDPSHAPVWSAILAQHDIVGSESELVSVASFSRSTVATHPWVLVGGDALATMRTLEQRETRTLGSWVSDMGFGAVTRDDAVFVVGESARRRGIPTPQVQPFITGKDIRDWSLDGAELCIWPYDELTMKALAVPVIDEALWAWRQQLAGRVAYGKTQLERGLRWSEYSMYFAHRFRQPLTITFAFVSTHNNFLLDRTHKVFNRHAPIIKLARDSTESDHQALLGYLNSSTVAFWCRLVMFPKGGDQVGDGARLSKTPWQDRLEYAGNLLQKLPVPAIDRLRDELLDLVVAAEETVREMGERSAEEVVAATLAATPTVAALQEAQARTVSERARLRGVLVSLQEEMDWRVYGLFGLPTVVGPSVEAVRVPVEVHHRPMEVRLARDVETDISASEWFRLHRRDIPTDVGGPLAELYRQRLSLLDSEQGRQLRLLETPETKRRWSPPDDDRAFLTAARTWLLERLEAVFRSQSTPELRSMRQLALELGGDPAVLAAHELVSEAFGEDLLRLLTDLTDAEGVPYLAGWRYSETGREKRVEWEETWRLQRLEDQGQLAPELKRLGLDTIPVPTKYARGDFLRHFWGLRGKLDVPKERFVTVPGASTDDDTTPLIGWAGWDHLQCAQALAALYQRRKTDDGWTGARLVPLLAGIAERVPWLLQWHDEPSAAFGGMRLGQFFRDFVNAEAHTLGVSLDTLRRWVPTAAPKRAVLDPSEVYAALCDWTPEVDDDADEDDEREAPEGPTADELASVIGANKAAVTAAFKVLLKDGRVEKTDSRPTRFVRTGDSV